MDELAEFKNTFFQECAELISDMEANLMALSDGAGEVEMLHAVFRAVHSIKGGAGAFGFARLVAFAHKFETVLDLLREGKLPADPETIRTMIRCGDVIADLVTDAQTGAGAPADLEAQSLRDLAHLQGLTGKAEEVPAAPASPPPGATSFDGPAAEEEPAPALRQYLIRFRPHRTMLARANEPLLFVRELKRIASVMATPDLESLPPLAEIDPDDAYLGWTFEVDGPCTPEQIEEVFEFVTGDCDLEITETGDAPPAPAPEIQAPAPAAIAPDMAAAPALAPVPSPVPAPVPAPAPAPIPAPANAPSPVPEAAPVPAAASSAKAPAAASDARVTSIRVDLDKVDKLVNVVGELVITQAMLAQQAEESNASSNPSFQRGLEGLSQHTRELQEYVMAIRAQPVKSVFQRIPRLIRELSDQTGKQVKLELSGENTEIDKTVIEQLGDPLTHMIRNAVDHGLESPEERVAAGKPAEGTIFVSAAQISGRIVIEIRDDGKGIPKDRVLRKAQEKGLVPANAALSEEEILNLIFLPGFSTAASVSNLSGRGVGMDVVRQNINALGGRVTVRSVEGQGSTFTLILPLTLAVMDGMVLRVGGDIYVLPISVIVETLRPAPANVGMLVGVGDVLRVRGELISLVHLGDVFSIPDSERDPSKGLVVIVETERGKKIGLVCDEILGQQQAVVKSLEDNFVRVDGIAAATILGSGKVALILDVLGLADMGHRQRRHGANGHGMGNFQPLETGGGIDFGAAGLNPATPHPAALAQAAGAEFAPGTH